MSRWHSWVAVVVLIALALGTAVVSVSTAPRVTSGNALTARYWHPSTSGTTTTPTSLAPITITTTAPTIVTVQ